MEHGEWQNGHTLQMISPMNMFSNKHVVNPIWKLLDEGGGII